MIDLNGVTVAHDRVPGRVRLRTRALKERPGLALLVERELRARPGVHDLQINPITGSVLVWFDPSRISTERLLAWTARSQDGSVPSRSDPAESGASRNSGRNRPAAVPAPATES